MLLQVGQCPLKKWEVRFEVAEEEITGWTHEPTNAFRDMAVV